MSARIRWLGGAAVLAVVGGMALVSAQQPQTGGSKAEPAKGGEEAKAPAAEGKMRGESNQQFAQPALIEASYPLASAADRDKSAKLLQQVTVDLIALANLYKEAHWNLNGPLYLVLHEYYDEQADSYRLASDTFAERLLHLGKSVDGRFSTVVRTTSLPDFPAGYVTDTETLQLLIERVTVLQKEVYVGIKSLEDTDAPSSNKLQDLAYAVDKNLWQLRIHLTVPGGMGETLPYTDRQRNKTTLKPSARPGK